MSSPAGTRADTWLERRDDRVRLLAFALVAAALSVARDPRALGLGLGAGALLAATSGLGAGVVLRRLAPVLALLVPVAALTPFWSPPGAAAVFADWPGGPTREGTLEAARIGLRAVALGLLAVGALSVPLARTLEGLTRLRVPAALVSTCAMTVRFVERLQDDLGRARLALGLRGFRPRADLASSRTYAALTGALLVRSVARTERVETAMRLRGFTGRAALPPRPGVGAKDGLLLLAGFALAGGVGLLEGWARG